MGPEDSKLLYRPTTRKRKARGEVKARDGMDGKREQLQVYREQLPHIMNLK